MKKRKIGLILLTVLLVACIAIIATACNPDDNDNRYTLSFFIDGEASDPIVSEAGLNITPPTAPEKENKRFLGWYLNNEGEAVDLPTVMPAEDRTYYAKYEDIIYTLTLIIDDETFDTVESEAGLSITPPSAPDKKDMIFLGWYLNNEGEAVDLPTVMPAEDRTYYGRYEEAIYTVPENYSLKYDQRGANNHLYIAEDGETVFIEYGGRVLKSELSADGSYVDFSAASKDLCAMLDGAYYDVYEYGFSKDSYTLFLPTDNSFNRERILSFGANNTFEVFGEETGTGFGASGTYAIVNSATQEYSLTVTKNNSYGLFSSCLVRLTKCVRTSVDDGVTYIYNAFNIFDEEIYGTYTNAAGDELALDGYGYATYTYANGSVSNCYCEVATVSGFSDPFFTVVDAATQVSSIYIISSSTFMLVGNEVGLYYGYDLVEEDVSGYYFYINGLGDVFVTIGRKDIATGSYEMLENGEFLYTCVSEESGVTVEPPYNGTFRFKLTTIGSFEVYNILIMYNPDLAATWTSEANGTIVLDGYGNATHEVDGVKFTGSMEIDNDLKLFLITDDNYDQRIFRFDDSDPDNITFRQIGLEIGNYDHYSYADGFLAEYIYLDGEGNVDLYVFNNETDDYYVAKSGTYKATQNEDEYELEFSDEDKSKITLQQLNIGSVLYPQWYTLYVTYSEELAGTFTGANGATLTLDGYGFNATYTDANGVVYEGEFSKNWNLVTLVSYDEEDNATVFTLKISGKTFILQQNTDAGVYYQYLPESDGATDNVRIVLGGDGTGCYTYYDDATSSYLEREAHYTVKHDNTFDTDIYTFTFDNSSDEPLNFIVDKIGTINVFSEYNERYAGSFVNYDGEDSLILDGYGRAMFKHDTTEIVFCTVIFGKNGNDDAVTFFRDGAQRTYILYRSTDPEKPVGTYEVASEPIGVYYNYKIGTVSSRDRLIIGANKQIELQALSDDGVTYETVNIGTYTYSKSTGIYTFNPEVGESFTFLLDEIGGYDVFKLHNGFPDREYTGSMTVGNRQKETTLTLDSYDNGTYYFYSTSDGSERVQTGYYYFSDDYECLIFIAVNEDGTEYWAYFIELNDDDNTFEIIDEMSPLYV